MKKLLIFTLSLFLILGLFACKKDPTSPAEQEYEKPTVTLDTSFENQSIKVKTDGSITVTTNNNVEYNVDITVEYIKANGVTLSENEEVGTITVNSDNSKTLKKGSLIKTISIASLESESTNTVKLNIKKAGEINLTVKVYNDVKSVKKTKKITIKKNLLPDIDIKTSVDTGQYPYKVSFDLSGSVDEDGSIEKYYVKIEKVSSSSSSANNDKNIKINRNLKNSRKNINKKNVADNREKKNTNSTSASYDGYTEVSTQFTRYYENAGEYEINVIAVDNLGGEKEETKSFMVSNSKPTAVIDVATTEKTVPATFDFSASKSSDQEGEITKYEWDFGDGTTATGVDVSHTYEETGKYQVQLTVYDNSNSTGTDTVTLTVSKNSKAPAVSYFKLNNQEIDPNNTITVSVSEQQTLKVNASDENGISKIEWYRSSEKIGSESLSTTPTETTKTYPITFSSTGQISVSVKVYDIFNNVTEKTGSINVEPKDPVAELNMVTPDTEDEPIYVDTHPYTIVVNADGSNANGSGGSLEYDFYYCQNEIDSTNIGDYIHIQTTTTATENVNVTLPEPITYTIMVRVRNTNYDPVLKSYDIRHVEVANTSPSGSQVSMNGNSLAELDTFTIHPYKDINVDVYNTSDPENDEIYYKYVIMDSNDNIIDDCNWQTTSQFIIEKGTLQNNGNNKKYTIKVKTKDEYETNYSNEKTYYIQTQDNNPEIVSAELTYSADYIVSGHTEININVTDINKDTPDEVVKYIYNFDNGTDSIIESPNSSYTYTYPEGVSGTFTPSVKVVTGADPNGDNTYDYTLESVGYDLQSIDVITNTPPSHDNFQMSYTNSPPAHPPTVNIDFTPYDPEENQQDQLSYTLNIIKLNTYDYDDDNVTIKTVSGTCTSNTAENFSYDTGNLGITNAYTGYMKTELILDDGKTEKTFTREEQIGNKLHTIDSLTASYEYTENKPQASITGGQVKISDKNTIDDLVNGSVYFEIYKTIDENKEVIDSKTIEIDTSKSNVEISNNQLIVDWEDGSGPINANTIYYIKAEVTDKFGETVTDSETFMYETTM